jgi:hypothetical protein
MVVVASGFFVVVVSGLRKVVVACLMFVVVLVVVEVVVVVLVDVEVVEEVVSSTHSSFKQVFSSRHPHTLQRGVSSPCRQ